MYNVYGYFEKPRSTRSWVFANFYFVRYLFVFISYHETIIGPII